MNEYMSEVIKITLMILALLIAIIGHEIMHGLVAYHYGDTSAKDANRLSLNPLRHLDIFGSVIVPLGLYIAQAPFLFGWAKPVPVDIGLIIKKRGFSAAIGVALAGVSYNAALAILAALCITSGFIDMKSEIGAIITLFLLYVVSYNVLLCVFNLLPIPPLDGSKAVLFLALQWRWFKVARFLESISPYGIFIIFIVLFVPTLSQVVFYPTKVLMEFLLR